MAAKKTDIVGKKIAKVRVMNKLEIAAEGWEANRHGPPVTIVLDDGTKLYPSRDPEGNGPGVMFGVDPEGRSFLLD